MSVEFDKTGEQLALELQQEILLDDESPNQSIMIGVNDPYVAEYATYLEYGWVQAVTTKQRGYFLKNFDYPLKEGSTLYNPPRPFLRGTLTANATDWVECLKTYFGDGRRGLKNALIFLGENARADIQETLKRGGTKEDTFPLRSEMTLALAEAEQMNHATDGSGFGNRAEAGVKSTRLLNSIVYWFDEEGS